MTKAPLPHPVRHGRCPPMREAEAAAVRHFNARANRKAE